MGGVSSVPNHQNILDQIKNKDYSVVSINDKPGTLPGTINKTSNITVSELKNIRTLSNTGACVPLPPSIFLKPGNTINKNIFISKVPGQHIRLYADRKCRKRANEEEYAAVNPPRDNLFLPNYTGKDTEFVIVPYQRYQNARFYRITDQPLNTPSLPQFYIKKKEYPYHPDYYSNKEFVEYDDSEPAVCRKIPTGFPEDFPDYSLDYHFQPKDTDQVNGRETGVDRYPSSKNPVNAAKNTPITIFTDVLKDGDNIIRDVNDNPFCTNIYTPSIINGGYKLKDGPKVPTSTQHYRYTPIPYTKVVNYGTKVAEETNSVYYELKGQRGILD
jgi:hypothetical protein